MNGLTGNNWKIWHAARLFIQNSESLWDFCWSLRVRQIWREHSRIIRWCLRPCRSHVTIRTLRFFCFFLVFEFHSVSLDVHMLHVVELLCHKSEWRIEAILEKLTLVRFRLAHCDTSLASTANLIKENYHGKRANVIRESRFIKRLHKIYMIYGFCSEIKWDRACDNGYR